MCSLSPAVAQSKSALASANADTQAIMQWVDDGGPSLAPLAEWIGDSLVLMHWADDGGATTVA